MLLVMLQMCCHILQKMVIQNILRSFHLLMHTCLCTICGKPMCISGRHPWFWMPIIQMPDSTSNDITSLPSYLRDEVDELNASYVEACHQYKLWKETTLHLIEERRQGVRLILSEAPVQSFEEPFYWISANWLRLWVDNIMPPVLDNTLIQCSHGKVHMAEVGSMKRLSASAWVKLFSKYGGGPALAKDDYCVDCLKEAAHKLVCADSYRDRRKTVKELADSVFSGNCTDGTYYVSKAWLQQWVKRKITDAPSEADAGPTASIRCPHGQLMPEQAASARRLLVPENLWVFFYEDAVTVNPDDPLGCPSFPIGSEQCSQCSEKISEVACLEDSLRAVENKQHENHEKLAAGKSFPLHPNHEYYLLPLVWLTTWRNYVNAGGKNALSCDEPESLDSVIDKLTCEKSLEEDEEWKSSVPLLHTTPLMYTNRSVEGYGRDWASGLATLLNRSVNVFRMLDVLYCRLACILLDIFHSLFGE
ncbi:ubiquitin carboxyl-terminal hydrolase 26-like isoform X2 [Eucalyptus grandis]|uniref:ubiquitin carboxyl-terminal hydrolase 26-like isoform X2 n=1 Tax=Eucalyptus grandis TaxID=71139 RepID=UPI00192EB225|nr:ubiquitin carboxyl-terminal hydrolase 26-like isoform X2 [Eucalyptus grandis]